MAEFCRDQINFENYQSKMSDSDEEITEITANEPAEKAPNVADQDDLD